MVMEINLDIVAIGDDDGEHCDSSCPFFNGYTSSDDRCRLFGWLTKEGTNDGNHPVKWKRAESCKQLHNWMRGV